MADDRLFVDPKMKEAREDLPTKISPADAIAAHRHPDDPDVISPRDVLTRATRHVQRIAATGPAASGSEVSRERSPRSVWFTGGNDGQPYTLHWSGPLHSKWDWVALRWALHGDYHILRGATSGWQWAVKGNSYTTGYTSSDLDFLLGVDIDCVYLIYNTAEGAYEVDAIGVDGPAIV